jgi:hypothetical protein
MIQICHDCGIAQFERFLFDQLPYIIPRQHLPLLVKTPPITILLLADLDAAELLTVCNVATFDPESEVTHDDGRQLLQLVPRHRELAQKEVTVGQP